MTVGLAAPLAPSAPSRGLADALSEAAPGYRVARGRFVEGDGLWDPV